VEKRPITFTSVAHAGIAPSATLAASVENIFEGIVKPDAVFRFSDTEGPGHFAIFLEANRVPWKLVKLDEGDAVPRSSEGFAGMGFMGGP
jgi:hypothetical protein